jgi:cardiolipin synthase
MPASALTCTSDTGRIDMAAAQRSLRWNHATAVRLLDGDEFFPRVFEVIRQARKEVLVETFIWFEDEVGHQLRDALIEAADRGASVDVTVDGYGTPKLSAEFLAPLVERGVRVFTFDPKPSWFGVRVNLFCRMHRKIVVVDGETAFVGGINYADDQTLRAGDLSKQDYAVEVLGPIVRDVWGFCHSARGDNAVPRRRRYWLRRFPRPLMYPDPGAKALFVTRDNDSHPTDIETLYRAAFQRARRDITLANAYFFPGYRFVRDLKRAAERGVRVRLILQGRPDQAFPQAATETLYGTLLSSGIQVYNYEVRALHAKVAVVDDEWATVGSSNLDPTSFALNLEANLVIRDAAFADALRGRLETLIETGCKELSADQLPPATAWRHLLRLVFYHVGRRFPVWGRRFPRARQQLYDLSEDRVAPERES